MAARKAAPKKPAPRRGELERTFEEVLDAALEILREASAPHALIGGLAVSARAAPRNTGDIDFAVATDEREAEQLVHRFTAAGFVVAAVLEDRRTGALATVRLRPKRGDPLVDLLFDFAGIEADIVAAASEVALNPRVRAPVATVAHLMAMTIQAARPKDLADLDALFEVASERDRKGALAAVERMVRKGRSEERDLARELREFGHAHAKRTKGFAKRFRLR